MTVIVSVRSNSVRKNASVAAEKKKKEEAPKQMYVSSFIAGLRMSLRCSGARNSSLYCSVCFLRSDQIPSNMFFKYNAELGPPYNVLVDTNFINFSIKNKLEVVSAMMDCLLAKCTSRSLFSTTFQRHCYQK